MRDEEYAVIQSGMMSGSLWQNPASHREPPVSMPRPAGTRREEGTYSQYVTDEQRSSGGMHRRSNAAGLLPQAAEPRVKESRESRSDRGSTVRRF